MEHYCGGKPIKVGDVVWFFNVYRPAKAEVTAIHERTHPITGALKGARLDIEIIDASHPFYRAGERIGDISLTQCERIDTISNEQLDAAHAEQT